MTSGMSHSTPPLFITAGVKGMLLPLRPSQACLAVCI
jgi:hypothetical protein